MKIYIYKIYFPESDKCYIGQTCNLQRRMKKHLNFDSFVGRALQKYDGWYKNISVLHICKSQDVANTLEIEEIRNHKSVAPNGYNLTAGGDGVFNPSEETRKKMSGSKIGNKNALGHKPNEEAIEKMRCANLGKKASDKTKKKLSLIKLGNQNSKGYKQSDEHKDKIRQANLNREHSKASKLKMRIAQLKRRAQELEQDLII